jgi:hypothetical protein
VPQHIWNNHNDWEYCICANCKIVGDTIVLDNSLTGTIVSDIRDSSSRISEYGEVISIITIPPGCNAVMSLRSGWYDEYTSTTWTDWETISGPEQRIEYTMSLSRSKIITDYNVNSLVNIYFTDNNKFRMLAANLQSLYLDTIDETILQTNELYSLLWSAKVGQAIVNLARTDYDGDAATIYATDASAINNMVILKNNLPADNVVVIIEYVPRYYIYSNKRNRYFQWKLDLSSNSLSTTPTVRSVKIDYMLDIYQEVIDEFPRFYRRL